jgi:hypothetical protein
MPGTVTRFGDTEPQFGLAEESSLGYIQEFNQKEEWEEVTLEDHAGTTVALALLNKKWSGSFTFIAKTGSTLPVTATSQALANLKDITKVIITTKDFKPEQKNFAKYTYEFKAYAGISLEGSP